MENTITGFPRIDSPSTWKEACLGASPFLAWGWVKGFPRWWFVFPGLLAIISAWMTDMPVSNLRFFHNSRGLLGFWAYAELLVTTVILLLIQPDSLGKLLRKIWQDWTLLSFVLYGPLAWLLWASLDENRNAWVPVCMAVTELLLAAGALAYMRAGRASTRFLSLLVGMVLAWLPATYVNALYWNGLEAPWMG